MAPAHGRIARLTKTKWAATVAGIWIQSATGVPSAFGVYSSALKSSQGYTQSTLDIIASVKDLGASFGTLSGLLYSSATAAAGRKNGCCGPWVVLLAGAAQSFAGYFLIWMAVAGVIDPPPVSVMCFFMLLGSHAMTFSNTSVVVTSVHNFREYSGTAVGIMKGFLGLSPAILVQVYQTIYKTDPAAFILMAALLSSICPLCLMWFVRNYDTGEPCDSDLLNRSSLLLVIIAMYLVVVTVLQSLAPTPVEAQIVVFLVLVLLLASPLFNLFGLLHEKSAETAHVPFAGSDGSERNIYHELPCEAAEGKADEYFSDVEGSMNLTQAIRTLNFWLLFLSLGCSFGSGLAVMNNLAQVSGSVGCSSTETSSLVSLWGIWNSLGRFGAGFLSDYMQHVGGWPRPLFMAITVGTLSIGHGIMASGLPGALHVGSILTGLCSGAQITLMPAITSDIFGLPHMGTIFNTIMLASSVGCYVFSIMFGYIYDREASRQQFGKTCFGARCFVLSFVIMAGATFFGSLVAMVLHLRTKRTYERIIVSRRRTNYVRH